MIRRVKKDYWKQSVSQCSGDSKKMWKALYEFMPSKASRSPNSIIVDDEVCNSNDATFKCRLLYLGHGENVLFVLLIFVVCFVFVGVECMYIRGGAGSCLGWGGLLLYYRMPGYVVMFNVIISFSI